MIVHIDIRPSRLPKPTNFNLIASSPNFKLLASHKYPVVSQSMALMGPHTAMVRLLNPK